MKFLRSWYRRLCTVRGWSYQRRKVVLALFVIEDLEREQRHTRVLARVSATTAAAFCRHDLALQRSKAQLQQVRIEESLPLQAQPPDIDQLAIKAAQDYLAKRRSTPFISQHDVFTIFKEEFWDQLERDVKG